MKAEDLVKLIRDKYPTHVNGYNRCVLLEQVPDGTSMYQGRWIDVAVFQMWQSKRLTRSAFEIKISRSDFIKELSNPSKYQWCRDYFHEFWFIAPKDVIQIEELPVGVGWMYPRGKKLCIARHAIRNDKPLLDDVILAGFMRAAGKEIERAIKDDIEEALQNDYRYKQAIIYADGIKRFLNERGLSTSPDSADEIFNTLENATMDKQLKQDRDHFLEITGRFQRDILSLLNLFIVIAKKSLFLRNETGRYIVSEYGGRDNEGLESLMEILKDNKSTSYQKRYAELIQTLLSWENISK